MAKEPRPDFLEQRVSQHDIVIRTVGAAIRDLSNEVAKLATGLSEQNARLMSIETKLSTLNTTSASGNHTRNAILIMVAAKFLMDGSSRLDLGAIHELLKIFNVT